VKQWISIAGGSIFCPCASCRVMHKYNIVYYQWGDAFTLAGRSFLYDYNDEVNGGWGITDREY